MFLKSLLLRGFKSFADKTILEFEPGVTVVVGPNGSGKSNLVDAVAWVLGAQGPRTLRGGKMDDVIFAGTPQRPALGRAEVALTIDNTAGLLPIEFTEVTITRTLFRTGESEYQINGVALPAARHPGTALRHGHRPSAARHRRAGSARHDPELVTRRPPRDRRGGGGHPEVPETQGARRAAARSRPRATCSASTTCSARCAASSRRCSARRRPPSGTAGRGRAARDPVAPRGPPDRRPPDAYRPSPRRTRRARHRRESELRGLLRALDDAVHRRRALAHRAGRRRPRRMARARRDAARAQPRPRGTDRREAPGCRARAAAAADDGVVETLVADAGRSAGPDRRARRRGRQSHAARHRRGTRASSRREEAFRAADDRWRAPEAEAARWRARADALEQQSARGACRRGLAELESIDGVVGPLVDHLEIEPGAEAAVASALGEAMRAVVVERR